MISDRDPRFAAHAFQELLKLLNIRSNLTTAYHPQSDGATERVNQEIEAYLAIYCTSHPEDWLHSLSTLEFMHNNRRHAKRIHTSFELIQGDSPIAVPITFSHTKYLTIEGHHGKFTTYSMQPYYDPTLKMKSMETITLDHYPDYWKEKKYMK